ncbi:MAG: HD-GYP domain-containing protein [Planctomycetes bacterium]|nr:HD-GYP domain-containing protein [Planctomycetota bacterium]
MKRLSIDMLVTAEELPRPLYHSSGTALFAKGEPLRVEHMELLREHRIEHVFELEEDDSLSQFIQNAKYLRIPAKDLMTTHKIAQPIYSADGKLLIQRDQNPTSQIKSTLVQQKIEEVVVYREGIKEDIALTIVAGKREIEKKHNRKMLAKMALKQAKMMLSPESISESTVDEALKNPAELVVKPEGESVDRLVSTAQKVRTDDDKKEYVEKYKDACLLTKQLYESIAKGELTDGARAMDVGKQAVYMMVDDKDLFCNLLNLSKSKGDFLIEHAVKTSFLATNIASALQFGEDQVLEVAVSALLADIGMMTIPTAIRLKDGPLTESERIKVKSHPAAGLSLLRKLQNFPKTALFTVYQHHERCNGTGYPKQLSGDKIHMYAKLVALADVYTALTSDRPYRQHIKPYDALEQLIKEASGKLFDPEIVKGQLKYLSLFPVGSFIELSNGQIARVISADKVNFARPVVQPLFDMKTKRPLPATLSIELARQPKIRVVRAIDHREIGAEDSSGF